ncbi:hypothetical protein [Chryseobacterium sp. R2A-55]|uniref:hypothetical protein n=1 Tax=Chryseobacterium sp. R2A-55 TaxID=2744445 RepID=UPI001F2AD2BE|nr:hypothetical protein [Chryseobacterium sp. R2A-55]
MKKKKRNGSQNRESYRIGRIDERQKTPFSYGDKRSKTVNDSRKWNLLFNEKRNIVLENPFSGRETNVVKVRTALVRICLIVY